LQGFWSTPEGRGKTVEELNARLPAFDTWEQAIGGIPGDDAHKTMVLQEAYGLPQSFEVKGGRIVSNDHSLRNGILGGIGVIGGTTALGALAGGGGAATALGPWDTPTGLAGPALATGPTLGSVSGATAAGTSAAGAGAGVGSRWLRELTTPQNATGLAALVGMLASHNGSGANTSLTSSPQVQSLLDSVTSRAKATDPLFQSINQLAMSRLPTSVQK
jgi:hypothetical protein